MALLAVYRPKPLPHPRCARLSAVSERDKNVIPLVSLHVLQVLHENGFALFLDLLTVCVDEFVIGTEAPEFLLNEIALLGVNCNQTECRDGPPSRASNVPHELYGF